MLKDYVVCFMQTALKLFFLIFLKYFSIPNNILDYKELLEGTELIF